VGYICANFILSVLDLRPMYATDRHMLDVRQKRRLMPPHYGGEGIITESIPGPQIYAIYCVIGRLMRHAAAMMLRIKVERGREVIGSRRLLRLRVTASDNNAPSIAPARSFPFR